MEFQIKKFLMLNIGVFIMACGLFFFLFPSHLAAGGLTGLAMILKRLLPSLSIGMFMLIANCFLFILAFFVIGKNFGGYTIYCSFALSGLIAVFEFIFPNIQPITDDLFLNLIFGIIIQGLGCSFIFGNDASTGGVDIVAKIINKYFHIEMGKSLFLADFLITLCAVFTFGAVLGLYALLGIILNSIIIDKAIAGFNTKIEMIINSPRNDEINHFILNSVERGTTVFYAEGGYSGHKKTLISTIVSRREYIKIKDHIKKIDPKAFVTISYVNEVLGEGFTYAAD